VGFQADPRETIDGYTVMSLGSGPDFSQSKYVDILIEQPDGISGSSFAAPLVTGTAVLDTSMAPYPKLANSAWLTYQAELLFSFLKISSKNLQDRMLKLFTEALKHQPHGDMLLGEEHWCVGCALSSANLMNNCGRAALLGGQSEVAEALLRVACRLAPHSPHASANLAETLLARVETGAVDAVALLAEAASLYDDAISRRPKLSNYYNAREKVRARLMGSLYS
jgi:hypothetical protein